MTLPQEAHNKISEALKYLGTPGLFSESKTSRFRTKLLICRADSFLKMNRFDETEADATEAIRLAVAMGSEILI